MSFFSNVRRSASAAESQPPAGRSAQVPGAFPTSSSSNSSHLKNPENRLSPPPPAQRPAPSLSSGTTDPVISDPASTPGPVAVGPTVRVRYRDDDLDVEEEERQQNAK